MDNLEKVKKVCDVAGVTYEDAKNALEKTNWDVLDAVVYLESIGKFSSNSKHSTKEQEPKKEEENQATDNDFKENASKAGNAILSFLNKSTNIKFNISKKEKELLSIPLLVVIILLLISFKLTLIALILGFFFGLRYSIKGVSFDDKVNDAFNKVSDATDSFKDSFKNNDKDK